MVEGKVDEAEVDPSIVALNEDIKIARVKLLAAQEAAEENWAALNEELAVAVGDLREKLVQDES